MIMIDARAAAARAPRGQRQNSHFSMLNLESLNLETAKFRIRPVAEIPNLAELYQFGDIMWGRVSNFTYTL